MKIVHTSDWHAGKSWKSRSRLSELEAILDHLAGYLDRERVEVLLVSGDIFDTGAPGAEAERAVFSFFKRVGRAGTRSVVIAGNHDNPMRLAAWGTLAELVDVHVVELPKRADRGGVIELVGRDGTRAMVAALPFAPPGRIVSALDLGGDDTVMRQKYAGAMQTLVTHLAGSFRADTVNLVIAHTHLEGAKIANSERTVHLGEDWAATAQIMPASAHYVGLGHIHGPQRVIGSPCPTYYAGSPMQLDFGEVSDTKSFVSIDARPGQPAAIEHVAYAGALPLVELRLTIEEIERDADRLREGGWLRVYVPLQERDPDIAVRVRRVLPNALVVRPEYAFAEAETSAVERHSLTPAQQYRAWHEQMYKTAPSDALLDAFATLYSSEEESECVPSA